jgi:hypothetical protein
LAKAAQKLELDAFVRWQLASRVIPAKALSEEFRHAYLLIVSSFWSVNNPSEILFAPLGGEPVCAKWIAPRLEVRHEVAENRPALFMVHGSRIASWF